MGERLKLKNHPSNLLQRGRREWGARLTVAKIERINKKELKNSGTNARSRRLGIQFDRVDSRQFLLIHLFSGGLSDYKLKKGGNEKKDKVIMAWKRIGERGKRAEKSGRRR